MSTDVAARASLAVSLAFHIVFAALGIGLPVMFCIAEGIGLRTRDATWYALARRWSRAAGILFVVGAVSGTALSFEFGLLWPRFMGFASGVVGLMFTFEGFAFFIEAIFLGLYLYGWDRLSPRMHWLCSIPVVISGAHRLALHRRGQCVDEYADWLPGRSTAKRSTSIRLRRCSIPPRPRKRCTC